MFSHSLLGILAGGLAGWYLGAATAPLSSWGLLARGSVMVLGAFAVALLTQWIIGVRENWRPHIEAAAFAAWIAPALSLWSQESAWVLAVAGYLAIRLASLARDEARTHPFRWPLIAAASGQLAILAYALGQVRASAGLGALACAIVASRAHGERARGAAGMLAFAVLAACLGLLRHWENAESFDLAALLLQAAAPEKPLSEGVDEGGGELKGVFLWPAPKEQAPFRPPKARKSMLRSGTGRMELLEIPFSGVYWIYKYSDGQPLRGSQTMHGSPAEMFFRSMDYRPIAIDARQNFGVFLEMSCCSRIQLGMQNREPRLAALEVELLLRDSSLPDTIPQSLGKQSLTGVGGKIAAFGPRPELLTFNLPADPFLRRFDEAIIRIQYAQMRRTYTPKLAVDRFVFVPRIY